MADQCAGVPEIHIPTQRGAAARAHSPAHTSGAGCARRAPPLCGGQPAVVAGRESIWDNLDKRLFNDNHMGVFVFLDLPW
jgi:hypothetical protein